MTKVTDTLTEEDFHGALQKLCGTVQVHCSRRRLLRRGQEFQVCTINKSAHTKRKSENLSYAPRYCHLSDTRRFEKSLTFLVLWSFWPCISFVSCKNGPWLFYEGDGPFLLQRLVSERILILLRYSFLTFFFHLHLFDDISFQYNRAVIIIVRSKRSQSFLICHFPMFLWSWQIFQYQIPLLQPGCIFQLFVSEFSVLFTICKYLYI